MMITSKTLCGAVAGKCWFGSQSGSLALAKLEDVCLKPQT